MVLSLLKKVDLIPQLGSICLGVGGGDFDCLASGEENGVVG